MGPDEQLQSHSMHLQIFNFVSVLNRGTVIKQVERKTANRPKFTLYNLWKLIQAIFLHPKTLAIGHPLRNWTSRRS